MKGYTQSDCLIHPDSLTLQKGRQIQRVPRGILYVTTCYTTETALQNNSIISGGTICYLYGRNKVRYLPHRKISFCFGLVLAMPCGLQILVP